jgi:glycine betaine/proline transport system permease protein
MDTSALTDTFDAWTEAALEWLDDNGGFIFDFLRTVLEGFYDGVLWALNASPFYIVAVIFAILGWRLMNFWSGVLTGAALIFCAMMGLWPETTSTLALVVTATVLALAIALPMGVVAGFSPALNRLLGPVMDLIQTMPPYIYLLPAIALFGFGPATAMVATVVVALPPALRLTALGIRLTPTEFIELGQATGMNGWQMFYKIRLPFAMPSIMAGINQSLMMAFGMVVIAGIVGSGGLGQTIYEAIRTLDIAKAIDGAIAIVILTMVLDRLSQSGATGATTGQGEHL